MAGERFVAAILPDPNRPWIDVNAKKTTRKAGRRRRRVLLLADSADGRRVSAGVDTRA